MILSADVLERESHPMHIDLEAVLGETPRVTRWSARSPLGGYTVDYAAEWVLNGDGILYPASISSVNRFEVAAASGDKGSGYEERFDLKITKFVSKLSPDPGRFLMASIGLPAGTTVKVQDGRGKTLSTRRTGGLPPPAVDRFKELAEKLGRGAFSGGGADQ